VGQSAAQEVTYKWSDVKRERGWPDDPGLRAAIAADRRKWKRRALYLKIIRNFTTVCVISAVFFTSLTLLGWWGYAPAIIGTAAYFTWKEHRASS